jgi:hypothetical protein
VLRQVGVLHRTKQGGLQAHQEDADQQQGHHLPDQAHHRDGHDHHFHQLGVSHDGRLVVLVGPLARRGRHQQEGQDEQGPDHQPGHLRRQPVHLQLVGHQDGQGKLEEVVVGGPEKLGGKERGKPSLLQQGKLTGVGRRHFFHKHILSLCFGHCKGKS